MPPRRQERGSQIEAEDPRPQFLDEVHRRFGVGARLGGEAERPFRRGECGERLGLAGTVVHGLLPDQDLLEHGDRLVRSPCQAESLPLKVESVCLDMAIALLLENWEGCLELAEHRGGIAAIEIDLGKAQPAGRLLLGVFAARRQRQGTPVLVEGLLWLAELAPDCAEVVQSDDLPQTVAHLPVELQGILQEAEGTPRLAQVAIAESDVVEQRGCRCRVAKRASDLAGSVVEAQCLLPITKLAVDHRDVVQRRRFLVAIFEDAP